MDGIKFTKVCHDNVKELAENRQVCAELVRYDSASFWVGSKALKPLVRSYKFSSK